MKKQVTITITFVVDTRAPLDGERCAATDAIHDVAYDMSAQIETLETEGFSVSQKDMTVRIS